MTITCVDFDVENNSEGHKFKVAPLMRIWKYKNVFAEVYTLKWFEEFFIKVVKAYLP